LPRDFSFNHKTADISAVFLYVNSAI